MDLALCKLICPILVIDTVHSTFISQGEISLTKQAFTDSWQLILHNNCLNPGRVELGWWEVTDGQVVRAGISVTLNVGLLP